MAKGDAVFENAIAMNSIGFFGMHIMTAGSYPSEEEGGSVYEERTEDTLKRLFVREGKLAGFYTYRLHRTGRNLHKAHTRTDTALYN
jgi:hypothetical protein